MLVYVIKIAILASMSMIMAFFSYRNLFDNKFGRKILIFSFAMLPFIFFQTSELIRVIVYFAGVLFLAKNAKPDEAISFFIVVIGLMPDWTRYTVSLPGIQTLIVLYFWKIAVIVLLAPYMLRLKNFPPMKWNLTDTLVCLFLIYTTINRALESDLNITQFLRHLTDDFLLYIIPYFVISRVIYNLNGYSYLLLGFLTLGILQACYFFFSQLSQIDLYNALNPYRGIFASIVEYRGGFLRLSGSLNGVLIGYLIAGSIFILLTLRKFFPINNFFAFGLIAIFCLGILFGGSRGALFSAVVMTAIFIYIEKAGTFGRFLISFLAVVFLIAYYWLGLSELLSYEDEYGTFDFRAELHTAAFEFLKIYPLFGRFDYIDTGMFDHMWRSTGIIDIVSVYLQVALPYGLIGLVLFAGQYLSIILPLLNLTLFNPINNKEIKTYAVIILSMLVGYMFLISTTSSVSLITHYGVILLAFGRSILSRRYEAYPS